MADKTVKALLVSTNSSHVLTQLPVAAELSRRGHRPLFLVRDSVVRPKHRVTHVLEETGFSTCEYCGYYESDMYRRLPGVRAYVRSKRAVFAFLRTVDFDIAIVCNDDAALFDRLVVDFCRLNNKESLLIQESVRPARRRLPLPTLLKYYGTSILVAKLVQTAARCLTYGPFVRRGYGHSHCTMIAAAGERFRRQLDREGVASSKIRVTGQPRLDRRKEQPAARVPDRGCPTRQRVLLFCSQPLRRNWEPLDRLFKDLVLACKALDDVRLLVKLHPRDLEVEHWLALLDPSEANSHLEVTKTRPLDECFRVADAVVTIASTTCLEAMAAGLPVGLVNYLPTPCYLPYDEAGAALSITSANALKDSIQKLLSDSQLRARLVANSRSVLRDELYLQDGQSASRIVDYIEERVYAAGRT